MSDGSKKMWARMADAQLQGAYAALRLMHTSPLIRGQALDLLKDLIDETYAEMGRRAEATPSAPLAGEDKKL